MYNGCRVGHMAVGGLSMNKTSDNTQVTCTAFCPVCGNDLVFQDNECICKNKECSWHCTGCKTEDDV